MMSSVSRYSALVLLAGLLSAPRPASAAGGNLCKLCHSEVEVQFRGSAHYNEDFTCVSCHGGDPSSSEVGPAHSGDFRGAIRRAEIPAFCARCHADPALMRPYGIPTDQYALYLTSGHGRKFAQGDARVAVCTDCHASHRILPVNDPQSPTQRRNISATCGRCHADAGLMRGYDLPADVVEQYEASVHAQALRQQGDPQAPDCTRCHGSHGAAPPGTGDVSKVCRQCHAQIREYFRLSPHQKGMAVHGQGECAACHGNHHILAPTAQLWVATCTACHEASSEAARTGEKIAALLGQATEELDKARRAIVQARAVALDVADYEARLNTAATYLTEAGPLSHSLDLAQLDELTRKSRSLAQEVQAEVHDKIRVSEGRELVAIFFWFYILVTIAAIQYYKRAVR